MGLYIVGLIWILVSGIFHFINLTNDRTDEKVQAEKIDKDGNPSFTSLIVQPLAESEKAKVVFEHLGYLLLLLVIFLLAPIPLERMKRFKLMNFEFEKESA